MTDREAPDDPHADRRESQRRRARHGMRVRGAGARLLEKLTAARSPVRRRKAKSARRKRA
jgi:hypothetical protein